MVFLSGEAEAAERPTDAHAKVPAIGDPRAHPGLAAGLENVDEKSAPMAHRRFCLAQVGSTGVRNPYHSLKYCITTVLYSTVQWYCTLYSTLGRGLYSPVRSLQYP